MSFERLKQASQRRLASSGLSCAAILAATLMAGCSESPQIALGAVMVTDAKGVAQPTVSIEHGQAIYLEVVVSNDAEGLGADWSVTCSSSLPPGSLPAGVVDTSCGTFAPYHTMSGPVPTYPATGILTQYTAPATVPKAGTVTIVAHATSLPTVTSTLTLTVT